MTLRWTIVDELQRDDHHFIEDGDDCVFLGEYQAGAGYKGETNSLILNLKKKPTAPHQNYKNDDIKRCSKLIGGLGPDWLKTQTFVPIPPSKAKDHAEYDDRLMRILQGVPGDCMDVRELVLQKVSTTPSHHQTSGRRPSIQELLDNYVIDTAVLDPPPSSIVIFDDVLTTGRHFKAMEQKIREVFPETPIIGMFIARRIPSTPSPTVAFGPVNSVS